MSTPPDRSAVKFDLFADAARKRKIEALGDPLQLIARHIDFDHLTQVIDDLLTMQQRINRLERELRDARNEIDTLELLRAHDIYAWRTARAEDQRRIVALEWAVQGQPWPACGER